MTYNERVQALAEKMAADDWGRLIGNQGYNFNDSPPSQQEGWVSDCIPAARIAVAEMAEAITEALNDLLPTEGEDYKPGDNIYVINGYLYSNGLIPDDGQGAPNAPLHIDHPKLLTCQCDGCKLYRATHGLTGQEAGSDDPY